MTVTDDPAALLATVDGMILPHGIIGGLPALELFNDHWLCLVAEDNPEVGESITLDDLATLPWAVYQRAYDAPAARQLSTLGIEHRVQVSVDSFYVLPSMVAGTRRVAMVHALLAARLGLLGLRQRHPGARLPVRRGPGPGGAVVASGAHP